jgi:hypothetical protein
MHGECLCSNWLIWNCNLLARLCRHRGVCWRIRFMSVITVHSLPATHFFHDEKYAVHSRFLLFICLAVFRFISSITHTSTIVPCLPYLFSLPLPWLHHQAPGPSPFSPQPLSLISLMHGLLYINPPLLKRRISILLGRGWLRRDQSASGLSACRKARQPTSWNTANSLQTPVDPFCLHVFINSVY